MKILITGCRGFIGSSFGHYAHAAGHDILGVSRSSQAPHRWPGHYAASDVATFNLTEIIERFQPELVFHAAGSASVSRSLNQPFEDLQASLMTWANTLDGIRRSGVRPVIVLPSSAAIYGNSNSLPISEMSPIAPISPYGFHKAACEWIGREYAECFGLPILICRIFSVFGPNQRRLLLWEIYEQLQSTASNLNLQGTGKESRDYLAVDDLSAAVLKMVTRPKSIFQEDNLVTVNLASGVESPIIDLATQIRDWLAPEKTITCRGQSRIGDPTRWVADVSLLHKLTEGWTPQPLSISLHNCLRAWKGDN